MKRRIAILLSVLMVITPETAVFGAEFSSGEEGTGIRTEAPGAFFSSDPADVYVVPETDPSAFEVQEPEIPDTEVMSPDGDQQDEFDVDILRDDPDETDSMGNAPDDLFDGQEIDIFQVGEDGTNPDETNPDEPDDGQEEEPQEKISINTCRITMSTSEVYTGNAIIPNISISNDDQILVIDQDYTLEYFNNTAIGTATVKITGIGDYEGEAEEHFKILPAAPKLKSASSAGYNSIKVTWEAVPGADSYTIYYKGDTIKSWKKLKTGFKGTSYVHTSSKSNPLVTGKQYTYTVKASGNGLLGSYDKTGKSARPTLGTVKLGKVQSAAYNKLKITWSKTEGASGYYIYRKSGSSWKKVGTTSGTSYTHKSSSNFPVKTGTTYTYTVKAYRKTGSTVAVGGFNKTGIKGKAVPDEPVLVSAECTAEGKITIRWKKAAGATNYIIYRKNAKGNWEQIKNIKGANMIGYTHVTSEKFPIVTGKTYTYTVRSYTTTGNTKGLFDKNGKKVKAETAVQVESAATLKKAKQIVASITTPDMSSSQKLKACFDWVISKPYVTRRKFANTPGWPALYANDHFVLGGGNCHADAAAFAYLAKALGYTNVYVCTDSDGAGGAGHSWAEINGLVYDPLFAEAKNYYRYYGVSYSTYELRAILHIAI